MPLGFHIYKNGKTMSQQIKHGLKRARDNGIAMECCQLFVIGPRTANETLSDVEKKAVKESILRKYVHGGYFDNPWGEKPEFSIHLIKKELEIADSIGATGLIIHLPKKGPKEIAEMLPKLIVREYTTTLFLEIESVKAGKNTYETGAKLMALYEAIEKVAQEHPQVANVGICIDTAHLWASGVDISSWEKARNWIEEVKGIGFQRWVIHLNDQKWERGSGRDEHAPLAFGTIWGNYNPEMGEKAIDESGLVAFLEWMDVDGVDAILERKDDKPKINGRPLIFNVDSDLQVIRDLGYCGIE
jgi:endonuclease IV